MHHSMRNYLYDQMKEILATVNLIDLPSMVFHKPKNIIDGLPELQPFDVSFIPGHTASDNNWKTPLSQIGVDVTVISPFLTPMHLPVSLTAQKKIIDCI